MTYQNHVQNTMSKMNNPSNMLADYLLRGWRIHEVSGDYRSVCIVHNKTNERKFIPFEGKTDKAFEKPYNTNPNQNLGANSIRSIATNNSTVLLNKINSTDTSQACQDQFCSDFVNDFVNVTPANFSRNNETHSTAATQGEPDYLKNYMPFQQNRKNRIEQNRNNNYSVNSGRISQSGTISQSGRISKAAHSMIVETGGISSKNKENFNFLVKSSNFEKNKDRSYHQPLHAINSIGSTVMNQQSQSTPIIHEDMKSQAQVQPNSTNGFHHILPHHHRSHSGASKPNNSKDHDNNADLRRISSPGLLVPHPVVRPNNRHSLDVPGPESVKEGQLVSEAVARNQEEAMNRRDQERNNNNDDGKGSVAVRYNEQSIIADDEEDLGIETSAKVVNRSEVENSDDISPENSAIDSSDVEDEEENEGNAGNSTGNGKMNVNANGRGKMNRSKMNKENSVSSGGSIIEAQASDGSSISSREKNLTTKWLENK